MSLERRSMHGIAASPGIAIGRVTVFDRLRVPVKRRSIEDDAIDDEVARLEGAMADARSEVEVLLEGLGDETGADHRLLLQTQLLMLGDELLSTAAINAIRKESMNAEWALRRTVDRMCERLADAPEAYFRERAEDVRLVGEHVLRVLTGVEARTLPSVSDPVILVASDLTPSETAQLTSTNLLAVVTDAGSALSHTAILARALRVPAVVGCTGITRALGPGDIAIVDALHGEVIVFPDEEEIAQAEARAKRFAAFTGRLRDAEPGAAETADGVRVSLHANVELELEVGHAKREGADGIGLYRTEFLYLGRREPPSEEEQVSVYERVARRMAPRPVTFRTFDLGADKMPHAMRRGPNPALGLRALRVAFEQPELLVTQLRALLRASVAGNVKVMFPMVASVADLRRAVVLLERARQDLDAEGASYGPVSVGSMLEVPSAVLVADRLAPECDFFSVGTNDLTQYTLAVDRTDPRVAHLASSLEPSVLRLLERARAVADQSGTAISICGDLAADPVATPVLIGLGLTTLSMPTSAIPLVAEAVRRLAASKCVELADQALECDGAADVERAVAAAFGDVLGDLWEEQGIELPRL